MFISINHPFVISQENNIIIFIGLTAFRVC
jgi:hypothetical protein